VPSGQGSTAPSGGGSAAPSGGGRSGPSGRASAAPGASSAPPRRAAAAAGGRPAGHAFTAVDPVIAAGIGLRRGRGWAVRAASFRVGAPATGRPVLGVIAEPGPGSSVIDLLAGVARPAYGELRVLGHDLATIRGRAAVRRRVGVARRGARQLPAIRIRGLVEHAARLARPDHRHDRELLAAAILDRLGLLPWAEVQLRAAPHAVARRARLAAAAVHQPELLLLDGLLDGLGSRDAAGLAGAIRDLSRDCGILLTGSDGGLLTLACDEILVLADGVLVAENAPAGYGAFPTWSGQPGDQP
jgi:ABC-2 type transport system ATP-binding protein